MSLLKYLNLKTVALEILSSIFWIKNEKSLKTGKSDFWVCDRTHLDISNVGFI